MPRHGWYFLRHTTEPDKEAALVPSNHRIWNKVGASLARSNKRLSRFLVEEIPIYLKEKDKKSLPVQARDLFRLASLYRYPPYHYFKHGLYREDFRADVRRFMPPELLHRTCDALNARGDPGLVRDKLRFEDMLASAGLPATQTLFQLQDRRIIDRLEEPVSFDEFVRVLAAKDLVDGIIVKPRDGGSGSAIFLLEVVGGRLRHQGRPLDEAALFDLVFATNDGDLWDRFLVQSRIVQHEAINRFNPTSVNTVRIDSYIDDEGAVHFNGAAFRVGAPGHVTDNASSGGYMMGIDLKTGVLAERARVKAKYGGRNYKVEDLFSISPSTFTIPCWAELLAVVRTAAELFIPFRSLGWDVALSTVGPVFIEANNDYAIFTLQEHAGGYLDRPLGQAYIQTFAKNNPALDSALRAMRLA